MKKGVAWIILNDKSKIILKESVMSHWKRKIYQDLSAEKQQKYLSLVVKYRLRF